MITLLLDSSNVELIVGIAKDNKLIDFVRYDAWQRQSELMINEINNLYIKNNIDPKSIDEIIVSNGPGSYTGLRIALTIAKIYGVSLSIPVYTLSSLMILQDLNKVSICVMNARSNRSYIGIYNKKEIIMSDRVLKNEEVLDIINKNKDYSLCGDAEYLLGFNNRQDVLNNMLFLKDESNKVKDILTLKAIYLKD